MHQLKIRLVLCLLEDSSRAHQCSTSSALSESSLLAFLSSKTTLSHSRFSRIYVSVTIGHSVCRPIQLRKRQQRTELHAVTQTLQRLDRIEGRGQPESARHTAPTTKKMLPCRNPYTTMNNQTGGVLSILIYQTRSFGTF